MNVLQAQPSSFSEREIAVAQIQVAHAFQSMALHLIMQANLAPPKQAPTPFALLSQTTTKQEEVATHCDITEAVSHCHKKQVSEEDLPLVIVQRSREIVKESFETQVIETPDRPVEPPDVVRLFFMVSLAMIVHNFFEMEDFQQQIKQADQEQTLLHQKKIEELNKQVLKEESESRWSTATKVFSIMASFIEVLSGIFLIATGNVVGGTMLLVAGLVQFTNHILKETGGWSKIAELLPGDDPDEKRAIVTWMQLGIGVLSIMVGGAGGVMSGKAAFTEGMQMANMFTVSVLMTALGICHIGQGISGYELNNSRSSLKATDLALTQLASRRQDLMEREEAGVSFIKRGFEAIGSGFQLQEDLNASYQEGF